MQPEQQYTLCTLSVIVADKNALFADWWPPDAVPCHACFYGLCLFGLGFEVQLLERKAIALDVINHIPVTRRSLHNNLADRYHDTLKPLYALTPPALTMKAYWWPAVYPVV